MQCIAGGKQRVVRWLYLNQARGAGDGHTAGRRVAVQPQPQCVGRAGNFRIAGRCQLLDAITQARPQAKL
ncbi:hypothetical protein D3C81_1866730 [compost metagenome]